MPCNFRTRWVYALVRDNTQPHRLTIACPHPHQSRAAALQTTYLSDDTSDSYTPVPPKTPRIPLTDEQRALHKRFVIMLYVNIQKLVKSIYISRQEYLFGLQLFVK